MHRILGIVSVSAAMILLTMDAGIATVALPFIGRDLGITEADTVLLIVGYNLVMAMTLLPMASLGEYFGLPVVFKAGLLLCLLGALLCLTSGSFEWLVVARSVQALGAAASMGVAIGLVRGLYSNEQLGRGMGINTMASVTGASLAPVVGGFVVATLLWRWVFAAAIPFAVISLALASRLPDLERGRDTINIRSAALCAAVFGLIIVGLQSLSHGSHPTVPAVLLLAGAVLSVIYVRWELNNTHPVLPVDLLVRPTIALSVGAALSAVLANLLLMLAMPFLLAEQGFGAAQIGALLFPYALTIALCAPTSGMLSDYVDPVLLGSVGLVIAGMTLASLAFLPAAPANHDIIWRMALCGVGFGLFFSPNVRIVVGSVPRARSAAASSLVSTARTFGQALGSTLFTALLALGLGGQVPIAILTTTLVVIALLLSLARYLFAAADS